MKSVLKRFVRGLLHSRGLSIVKSISAIVTEADRAIIGQVMPFTMTSEERIAALLDAVNYIESHSIPGDVVECGVWKGGSSMAAAMALLDRKSTDRTLFLYDTFEGMSEPTEHDRAHHNQRSAAEWLSEAEKSDTSIWAYSPLNEVKANLARTGYPAEKLKFVQGKVEDTIPGTIPERIALLRLDTDWYESTRHELIHLFPRLVPGGVLIIDDFGFWEGARKAVEEYLAENEVTIFLSRIDYTGRIGVKF